MADIMKFLNQEGLATLVEQIKSEDVKVLDAAKKHAESYTESLADNYDAAGTAATKVQELADGQVKDNTDAIAKLNGSDTTEGSVAKQVADAKKELEEAIEAVENKADKAQEEVDAVEVDLGDVDDLSTTNKTIVGAINEVLTAVGTGGTAAVVTVTTDTTTDGALKSYTIKQGDETVGVIDIPKDMVVESGSVVTNPEGQAEGTYIKLVLANVAEPLYINVGSLVDIYTAKADATQVQLSIDSSTREISATIVAGSIGSAELADGAVTTVKIADANVTLAKLSASVQASLAKADAAAPQTALDAEVERARAAEEKALTDAKDYTDTEIGKIDLSGIEENASDIDKLEESLAEGGATANAIADAKKAGTDAQADVDALEAVVGEVTEGKTVVQMIADAQEAATYDDTDVKTDIQSNTDAITELVATHNEDKVALQASIDANTAALEAIEAIPNDEILGLFA